MWRNTNCSVNLTALKNRLSGKRVLVVNDLPEDFGYDLRQFFDVIMSTNDEMFKRVELDIFVDTRPLPYTKHVLDCHCHEKFTNTLFLMRWGSVNCLSRSKRKLNSHILTYDLVPAVPSTKIFVKNGIALAVSEEDPAAHIAMIGGATSIYTTYESSAGKHLTPEGLLAFVEEKGRYGIPTNFRHKNRKSLIQGWS